MRLILWAIAAVIVVLAVVFAVHNFERVTIDLWPFPITLDMPLYAVILGSAFAGVLIGAAAAWLGAGKWRKLARQRGRSVSSLTRQLAAARESEPPTLDPRHGPTARTSKATGSGTIVPVEPHRRAQS